jgi:surface carbohydrate biosynthesis protein
LKRRLKVGLIVDNPKRDLAGLVLVAHELLKLGIDAYVIPMYQQGYDVPLIMPDAVVVNYARMTNRELLRGYRELGIAVIVLDTEGGVLSEDGSDSPGNWARMFKENGLDQCVDRYLFWGVRVHDAFVAAGVLSADRLQVTGCPRYDFCRPPWNRLLRYPERGFVLVNTNFSAINPQFTRSADDELEIFIRTGWSREYTLALFKELRAVFPRYLDTVARMAERNPQRNIVVRPHPFEDADVYRRRYGDHANVTVDAAGSVFDVLDAADCMVHLNCGSAVETVLLGKTPISLEYLNTDRMRRHASLPSRISCRAKDETDLDCLIDSPAVREQRWDRVGLRERCIEPWFHTIDGRASARTAAAVADAVSAEPRCGRASLRHSAAGGVARPSAGQLAQGVASQVFGSRTISVLRSAVSRSRRDKTVEAEAVTDLLQALRTCDGTRAPARAEHAAHPLTRARLATLRMVVDDATC